MSIIASPGVYDCEPLQLATINADKQKRDRVKKSF
jgi:hypothetical protein